MFLNGATNSVFLSRARAPSLPRVRLQRVLCSARGGSDAKIDGASLEEGPGGCLQQFYPVWDAVL